MRLELIYSPFILQQTCEISTAFTPFYGLENGGPERASDLPKVTPSTEAAELGLQSPRSHSAPRSSVPMFIQPGIPTFLAKTPLPWAGRPP